VADIIELIYADHDWLRRQFFYLDDARTEEELTAVWEPLATRLDIHAAAEEAVFYPVLLRAGHAGDPTDETEDAITDHNKIRDAIRDARNHRPGSPEWFEAVGRARTENGEHLDEEEREALPDFAKSASTELRHELAMHWLRFYYRHPLGADDRDKDPDRYIAEHRDS
jgi:hypothetical protein